MKHAQTHWGADMHSHVDSEAWHMKHAPAMLWGADVHSHVDGEA